MKKRIAMTVAAALAAVFAVADAVPSSGFASHVFFRSEGPDFYADGTLVADGEIYALVWSRTDAAGVAVSEFVMDAKGEVADPDNHKVLARAAIAKGGRCPPNVYLLDAAAAALASQGVFKVYLLDTRARVEEGGAVTVGFGEDGVFSCNGYELVPAKVDIASAGRARSSSGDKAPVAVSGRAAVATVAPAGARTAEITRITPPEGEGDVPAVTVGGTEPCIRYSLLAYENLDEAPVDLSNGVNGSAGGEIELSGGDAKYRFFRLTRSGIRSGEGGQ